jgi:4-hydroxy-2,2'-bipyrrole-5-carbaldehyde O-methyltransferase
MTLRTFWRLIRQGDLSVLLEMGRLQRAYYRLCFLSAALQDGLLARLAQGPLSFEQLAAEYAPDPAWHEGLRAWLDFGVRLGELRDDGGRYALHGRLAHRLGQPQHDAAAALIEEAGTLHHALLMQGLSRLHAGHGFRLADQHGDLVARSSRLLEPFVYEAVGAVIPPAGAVRLLEIGCGSGTYIRRAAALNARLTAVGLELQPVVAQQARENLRAWGLAERVTVEVGDVRARPREPSFDVATLHNNIYYFPVAERSTLLAHVRGFLRPSGRLLVTTACHGGRPEADILNVWAALTEGCGRLPTATELERQLAEAGYTHVRSRRLIPGQAYYAFVAECPALRKNLE